MLARKLKGIRNTNKMSHFKTQQMTGYRNKYLKKKKKSRGGGGNAASELSCSNLTTTTDEVKTY